MSAKLSSKLIAGIFALISFVGFLDATYLTILHYRGAVPTCIIVHGCSNVTTSKFSTVANIPVALLGSLYYLTVLVLAVAYFDSKKEIILKWISQLTIIGLVASAYFVFLQIFVIKYICIYCMASATTSTLLFITGRFVKPEKNASDDLETLAN